VNHAETNEFDFLSGSSATEETPAVAENTPDPEALPKKKRGFLDFLGFGKRKSAQSEQTLPATQDHEAENSTPQSDGEIPNGSEIPAAASVSVPEEAPVSDAEPAIVGEAPESEEESSANDDPLSSFLQGFQP